MKTNEPIVKLILQILKEAVENKSKCYVTLTNSGVSMNSYQDKLGYSQTLEYYASKIDLEKPSDILMFGLVTPRGGYNGEPIVETREGDFLVKWEKVMTASVQKHSGNRYLIKIDNLNINFLD